MADPLAPIRRKFRQRCAEDLEQVRLALNQPTSIVRADLRGTIHRLVGMAGSVGFYDLSDQAAELDTLLTGDGEIDLPKLQALEAILAETALPPEGVEADGGGKAV